MVFISRKEGRKEGKDREKQERESWGESPFGEGERPSYVLTLYFSSRLGRVYEIRIESASHIERYKSYMIYNFVV